MLREVLRSKAYDRLRASLGDGFERLCADKIHVVGGDLTMERLGIDAKTYDELTKQITLVVNSAATVTFDEQLDLAIELNARGPGRLLQFARDCGNVPMMQVSTCYVCGDRSGVVAEEFGVPDRARDKFPRCPDTGAFDLDGLVDSMVRETAAIKERLGAGTEACRRALIETGMQRARLYGWNDTYTFTKWLGEQFLVRDHGDVPVVIFRPAIIESSYEEPMPGWIDGLRMADPVLVAYGRGKLKEFPGLPDVAMDMIPVDFVSNAMIATLPSKDSPVDHVPVYHCASSGRRPCHLRDLRKSLQEAFRRRPMYDDDGKPIVPRRLKLVEKDRFIARWRGRQRRLTWLRAVLKALGITGRRYRKLASMSRQIEQVIYFAKIYSPYTHLDCRFGDDALQAVARRLHPDDRKAYPFDVEVIDWDDYIVNRHIPGLGLFVLGTGSEPTGRLRAVEEFDRAPEMTPADALAADNLFGVFEHSVRRFKDKPALQVRRGTRWIRYTYEDALLATGSIVRRLGERGLEPGDRVAICSESSPEWGLTYLAIMRAGMTAVPLDPQIPADENWAAVRFVEAKLLCASPTTFDGLHQSRGETDVPLVTLGEPFVPPPGASRDAAPDPVSIDGTAPASILFTSGTTVAPKVVALTHRNFIANAQALLQVHRIHASDELLSVLPMYHAFEFTGGFLVPIVGGATITYITELKGPEIRAAMQATGTSVMLVVPRLLRSFLDGIENKVAQAGWVKRAAFRLMGVLSALSGHRLARHCFGAVHKGFGGRLRMFVCGGSRLEPDLGDAFERMGFPVYEGYGLTETSPVLAVNPHGGSRRGSVGKVLPNVEITIRNQNLEGIGEVWVRGPSVMTGYLNNPKATSEVVVDGWFDTGDLGRKDAEDYLYITGRSKDLIVTQAGKNVYPDEVEWRYRELPHVKEFCVFGMDTEDGIGDTIHAVAVMDDAALAELDRSSIEREIRLAVEAISQALPTHQRISALHLWDRELPKTSTLKAKRGRVRDAVRMELEALSGKTGGADASHRDRPAASAGDDRVCFPMVRQILARQTKRAADTIHRDAHLLLDLGIDSIGKLDVLGEIEAKFNMRIDDEKGAKIARVVDLLNLIGSRRPVTGGRRDPSAWRKRVAGEATTQSFNGQLAAGLLPVRWLLRGSVGLFLKTYVRVRAVGRLNIPTTGAFILAPNHSSHLDSPTVMAAVGGKRRVWVAGAEDYFFNTRFKRFIFGKILDTIAFDRHGDGLQGLRRCGEALGRGDGLLLYPEGTRSITGRLGPFKTGVAVLAIERSVPIIPVFIDRTYELLPKGGRFVRPGTITVTFGPPIQPPSPEETQDHYAAFREVTAQVEAAVSAMTTGAPG
ncbi:MAG: AMP-binding protein [Planctomycetes bacterium]|nr:AMP-binding protein [Planctomycetota bacterium]